MEIKYQDIKEYKDRFELYPNPIDDYLYITTEENINKIEIYNIMGVMILEKDSTSNKIDLSDLNNGIYFIKIKTDKGTIVKRIVKS